MTTGRVGFVGLGNAGAPMAETGARLLDAPVSGGQSGARDGTLSIVVGGATLISRERGEGLPGARVGAVRRPPPPPGRLHRCRSRDRQN